MARRTAPLAAAALLLLSTLAGCGEETDTPGGAARQQRDELAAHDGRPCPRRLPQGADRPLGTEEPADGSPSLRVADRAWVCEYAATGDVAGGGWPRQGPPGEVTGELLALLREGLAALRPADGMRVCTEELGPRWMLVLSDEGDLTGVVVDGYGCRDVRLTDEPFTTVPGEAESPGVVAGVLTGPDGLLPLLERAGG